MIKNTAKYIIVGAGLSGLTSAYFLNKLGETDFLILESRDRVGGRILTKNEIDFGATWFQDYHENVADLLTDQKIEKFYQYNTGESILIYNCMAPAHYFQNDPDTPSAYRISGGSSTLIDSLASSISSKKIKTDTFVSDIIEDNDSLLVRTNNGTYRGQKVIVTIPPAIASKISFFPKLPISLIKTMRSTHTWMSNAIKVGLTFETPFWRAKNLSGTLMGQMGIITELYDHSDVEEKKFALMGFVNEALRDIPAKDRKVKVLDYLQKYLGDDILDYTTYKEKDWSLDRNTSCPKTKSIYMCPCYGNPKFEKFYLNNKLLFSGTETSSVYGGYMDGAIYSGILAAKKVIVN